MRKYKSVFLANPKFTYGVVVSVDDTVWYINHGYHEIDRETLPGKYYDEFRSIYFKPFDAKNPSNLEDIKVAFEVFKQEKVEILTREHQESLARKREGKKFNSILVLNDGGHSLSVYNAADLEYAQSWRSQIIDIYNYPNHYYYAFRQYLVKNHCDGSMYRNPKSYAEVLFLFKVFQTEYKDYAAVKKQQRAEAKLKAEQEAREKEQQELVVA